MDMPSPCPSCCEVVEFNDMVNHPNEFKTMVCEECHDRIEEENNRGEQSDSCDNKLEWIANPDDGLIDFKVNGEPLTTWSYEDDPEMAFVEFISIWNKAQESILIKPSSELESLRDAIQACENQGFRVMYGDKQVTGAIVSDGVIELVNE